MVATDPNMDSLTYSLSGADFGSFQIVSSSGQIQTRQGVQYDHEGKSSYSVTVIASDGAEQESVEVAITITDVDEPPGIPGAPAVTPSTKTSLEASWSAPDNTGPAINDYDLRYRKVTDTAWATGSQSGGALVATVTGLDVGTEYEVQVRATNDEGTSGWSTSGRGSTLANARPVFGHASYSRSVAENSGAGQSVGAPVVASDEDTAILTYTLEGLLASHFVVGKTTGQISTVAGVTYDHELRSSYSLRIRASDGSSSGSAVVSIRIEDVSEPPSQVFGLTLAATKRTRLVLEWLAPENSGRPPIESYDLRHREKTAGAAWVGGTRALSTAGTLAGLTPATTYEFQVRARNAEGAGPWSEVGEGRTDDALAQDLEAPTPSVGVGDQSLRVEWDAPSDAVRETTYDLAYRISADGAAWTELAAVASGRGPHRTLLPRLLENGRQYSVRVRQSRSNNERVSPWSAIVTATPVDQGSGDAPAALPKGTVVGGVVDGASGTDSEDSFSFTAAETVCYVRSPSLSSLTVATSPPTGSRYVTTMGRDLRRLVMDGNGDYTLTLSASSRVEYEIICRDTLQATTLADAPLIDRDFPSDVLWTGRGDAFFYRLRLHEIERLAVRTVGRLDTVVALLDGAERELAISDDGWQLGNVTNALVHPVLLGRVDIYVRVSFPYTSNARQDERNIPLVVDSADFSSLGGGESRTTATTMRDVGQLESQGGFHYFDSFNPVPLYYGELRAGEPAYWRFIVSESDGHGNLFVRATAAAGAELTMQVLDEDGGVVDAAYVRAERLYGGSAGGNHVDAVTVSGRFVNGAYYLRIGSDRNAGSSFVYHALSVAKDTELDRYDDYEEGDAGICHTPRPKGVEDQYFPCQWHLGAFAGVSMGIQESWEAGYTGEGVGVAVFDEGYDWQHPDLLPNVVEERNLNVRGGRDPFAVRNRHGTAVAGILAAKGDERGIRGVAPDADLWGVNVLAGPNVAAWVRGITHEMERQVVGVHSYGVRDDGQLSSSPAIWNLAADRLVKEGAGGLGTAHVISAGNGGSDRRDTYWDVTTLDETNSHMGVIPVCALGDRLRPILDVSEPGANIWICGPSRVFRGMFTTTQYGRYADNFGGTSAAAPAVAGAIALLRQAAPDLSWRDVKLIVAESATKFNTMDTDWVEGAATYSGAGTYSFDEKFGFGLMNANDAIALAEDWVPVPSLLTDSACSEVGVSVPIDHVNFTRQTLTLESSPVEFVEHVEFHIDMTATMLARVELWVGSPRSREGGTRWASLVPFRPDPLLLYHSSDGRHRYSANLFLGEDASGDWKLAIKNRGVPGETLTLHSWEIVVYGHGSSSTATGGSAALDSVREPACGRFSSSGRSNNPTVQLSVSGNGAVTEGGTLTVTATASRAPGSNLRVPVQRVAGGSSAGPSDYSLPGITITAGATSGTATFTATNDTADEPDETLRLALGNVSGYDRGTSHQADIVITDDDATTVALSVPDATATEDNSSATATIRLTLGRGLVSGEALAVPLNLSGGTAGADFTLARTGAPAGVALNGSTVTFTGPQTGSTARVANIRLTPASDPDAENRTVAVDIPRTSTGAAPILAATNLGGGATGNRSGNGEITITDDERKALVFSVTGPVTVVEEESASYTVKLASRPTGDVDVAITGQGGSDLTLDKTSLTFTASTWNATQTVTVTDGGDSDLTNDRVILGHAASGGGYDGVSGTVTVNVTDDDAEPPPPPPVVEPPPGPDPPTPEPPPGTPPPVVEPPPGTPPPVVEPPPGPDPPTPEPPPGTPPPAPGPPKAGFTISGAVCESGLCTAFTSAPVTLTDTSTGIVAERAWETGDGGVFAGSTVVHAWRAPGFYRVTLTVGGAGASDQASASFLVRPGDPAGTCEPDAFTLCLRDERYLAEVNWWTASGEAGRGIVVRERTNDSGVFRFFGDTNWDILLKVLDGCDVNGSYWVFTAATTDVGYEVTVADTTGPDPPRVYRNEPGMPAPAVTDTSAFPNACER